MSDFDRLGGHRGHPIADVADLVVKRNLVVGLGIWVRLTTGGVLDSRHVAVVDHSMNAGQGSGRRVVDGDDPSVGVGAAENLGVQQTAHLKVVGERRVALY